MAKRYVKAYYDWIEQTAALSDAERGRLFIGILEYARSGLLPDGSGRESLLFPVFKSIIDRDAETSANNAENGAKGGRGNKAKKANESEKSERKRIEANESEEKPTKDIRHKTKDKDKDKDGFSASSNEDVCPSDDGRGDVQTVIDAWNSLGLNPIRGVAPGSARKQILGGRLNQDGLPLILQAIENVRSSAFLNGQNNRGFTATFDWFIKPSNFQKVLDGNYNNRRNPVPTSTADRLAQMIEEGVFGD